RVDAMSHIGKNRRREMSDTVGIFERRNGVQHRDAQRFRSRASSRPRDRKDPAQRHRSETDRLATGHVFAKRKSVPLAHGPKKRVRFQRERGGGGLQAYFPDSRGG